ncbi:MAG: hypothetical protein QNJ70_18230 [Xenococcaceae cyanobacterium MO_207.B15]|nr:hypothetical protein [Xenococcaceae cyanobacterium MO_207.B15]
MNQNPKTKHLKVYAPNVHLFAFHLVKEEDDQLLWRKCQEIFTKFNIESTLNIESRKGYRVDLLKRTNPQDILLPLESEITLDNEQLKITGFAYPLRLHDTYILCLNLRRPEQEITSLPEEQKTQPVSLQFFQSLNPDGCFLPQNIGSSLGQTLLLTVWYTSEFGESISNRQELRKLSDQCLENFVNQHSSLPEFNQTGELFDSPIFEYGFPSQIEGYCHILVWICCEPETEQKFQDTYQNLINLFAYRNKIIQAYQDSRQLYQEIAKKYQNLDPYLDKIFQDLPVNKHLTEVELNQFKQYIKDISNQYREYSNLIRNLDHYRLTIEINIKNYQRELNNISSQFSGDNISFLETFVQEDCHLFQEQLQADLGYFKHGTELLEQALKTIRGRVEIDQADRDRIQQEEKEKSDRQLQITLTSLGAGIAVGGIVASSSGQVTEDNPIYFPWQPEASNQLHPFTWFVIVSIVCGLIAFVLMTLIVQIGSPKK